MELSALFQQLLSHSPFVAFLLYQYWQQRKDMAQLQQRYEDLRKESKAEEEALRQRYQKVIETYTEDRKTLIESLEKRISNLEKSIRKLFSMLEDLKIVKKTVQELEIDKRVRDLK
jgi:cell division protein FtsB